VILLRSVEPGQAVAASFQTPDPIEALRT